MIRTIDEIMHEFETVRRRVLISVVKFREMSADLARLGRTTEINYANMETLFDELKDVLKLE